MWPNPQKSTESADLVTYTEEILNRKIYFCAVHPVAATEDLIDYVKPIVRKKTKMLVIHTGTSDLSNDTDTIKRVKKVVQESMKLASTKKLKLLSLLSLIKMIITLPKRTSNVRSN